MAELIANTTKGDNCISADPYFTDADNYDYTLQAGVSSSIEAGYAGGTVATIYDRYENLFGESIDVDKDGTTRVIPWDIGAYENTGGAGGATYFFSRAN